MPPKWHEGLDHRDWLFDGHPIKGAEMRAIWARLDWDGAWIDRGPSLAGNPGPYWHVPLPPGPLDDPDDRTVHRLYPKLLRTKWLGLVRQAMYETSQRYGDPLVRILHRRMYERVYGALEPTP